MQQIKHEHLQNNLTLAEIEIGGQPNHFVLDTDHFDELTDGEPWYFKQQSKSKNGMPYLINRKSVSFLRSILKATENQRVYNVSRNPFDLRKCNYLLVENGKHRSVEFQKLVEQKLEENKESNEMVAKILEINSDGLPNGSDDLPNKKEQAQVGRPEPVGNTRIWQEIGSNNIRLEFEDGSVKEISLNEAKWVEHALKTVINRVG